MHAPNDAANGEPTREGGDHRASIGSQGRGKAEVSNATADPEGKIDRRISFADQGAGAASKPDAKDGEKTPTQSRRTKWKKQLSRDRSAREVWQAKAGLG